MPRSGRHHDITPAQCRAARALLGLTQPELGELSSLSRDVIVRLERGEKDLHYTTPGRVEAALKSRGVSLVRDEMGVGVKFERHPPVGAEELAGEIITPAQCRAARALLDVNTRDLATLVGGRKRDLHHHESGQGQVDPALLKLIRATLVVSGIVFTNDSKFVAVQVRSYAA
jgi:DNA-binding XRE family transcriptional regulator